MARASWKGYFRIGNVVMPVRLYAATRSIIPHFIQLHRKDHSPVQRVTVCMKDGEKLKDGDIVRAAEYDGKYVELSEDELERQAGFERDIVVRQITEASEINPIYYDSPYYLVPDKGGELVYSILRRAFEKVNKIAIVTLLFYGRERIGAVSSFDGTLRFQLLRFHDEILPRSDAPSPALPQPSPAQISVASQLLERYNLAFHPSDYRNQQIDILNELVERKAKGLPPKKHEYIAESTTPENEVIRKMKEMLKGDPQSLQDGAQ